jgi:RNA polymerase sigma factor (sigma-70 family)
MSLSAKLELSLISQVQSNPPTRTEALERLTREFNPLLLRESRLRSDGNRCLQDDLYQEGFLGLYSAIGDFDIGSGFRLSTLAVRRIRQRMQYYLIKENRYRASHLPFQTPTENAGADADYESGPLSDNEGMAPSKADLLNATKRLPARQEAAIFKIFWEDCRPSEAADQMGISRSRVTKLVAAGLKNLKKEVMPIAQVN